MVRKKKNQDSGNELSLKDAAKKLDVSEATVRKYARDFKLDGISGTGNKATVSDGTFKSLKEIVKLRTNGLSIKEIKDLISSKTAEETPKVEEPEEDSAAEEVEAVVEEPEETEEDEEPDEDSGEDDDEDEIVGESEDESGEDDEDDEDDEDEDEDAEPGQRKRKIYNRRYVERQISRDSKRVQALRQRLSNPNLPIRDKMFYEEALERRIHFLDGWRHILKWVSLGSNERRNKKNAEQSKESEDTNNEVVDVDDTSAEKDDTQLEEANTEA